MRQVYFDTSSGSPNSPEWHAWRANGIGGSDTVAIAAEAGLIDPPSWIRSTDELFAIKVGKAKTPPPNAAMQRGTQGEEEARKTFERVTGIPVAPVFGEMDDLDFIRASMDGMSFSGDLIVEIKCPNQKVHSLAQSGQVVEYYLPQLAHQALVAWGHPEQWKNVEIRFASFVPETGDIAIVDIDPCAALPGEPSRSLRDIAEPLIKAEKAFWDRVLRFRQTGEDRSIPRDALEAAARYLAAHKAAAAAKEELEAARKLLLGAIPEGKTIWAGGGLSVKQVMRSGNVDYSKLLKELGVDGDTIEKYRKPPTEVWVVEVD